MQENPTNIHTNFHVHMLNEIALTLKKNAYCVFISQPITCLKWNKLENPNLHLLGPPGFPPLFLFLAKPQHRSWSFSEGYEGNSGIFLWRRLKVNMCNLVSCRHTFPNSHFVKQGADSTVTQVSLFRVWISSGTPVLHVICLMHTPTPAFGCLCQWVLCCVLCHVLLIRYWLTLLMFGCDRPFSDLWLR